MFGGSACVPVQSVQDAPHLPPPQLRTEPTKEQLRPKRAIVRPVDTSIHPRGGHGRYTAVRDAVVAASMAATMPRLARDSVLDAWRAFGGGGATWGDIAHTNPAFASALARVYAIFDREDWNRAQALHRLPFVAVAPVRPLLELIAASRAEPKLPWEVPALGLWNGHAAYSLTGANGGWTDRSALYAYNRYVELCARAASVATAHAEDLGAQVASACAAAKNAEVAGYLHGSRPSRMQTHMRTVALIHAETVRREIAPVLGVAPRRVNGLTTSADITNFLADLRDAQVQYMADLARSGAWPAVLARETQMVFIAQHYMALSDTDDVAARAVALLQRLAAITWCRKGGAVPDEKEHDELVARARALAEGITSSHAETLCPLLADGIKAALEEPCVDLSRDLYAWVRDSDEIVTEVVASISSASQYAVGAGDRDLVRSVLRSTRFVCDPSGRIALKPK
jgi:hypothetical protein